MILSLTYPIYLIDIIYTELFRFCGGSFFIFKSSVIVRSFFAGRDRPFCQSSNIRKPPVTRCNSMGVTVRKITVSFIINKNVRLFELLELLKG